MFISKEADLDDPLSPSLTIITSTVRRTADPAPVRAPYRKFLPSNSQSFSSVGDGSVGESVVVSSGSYVVSVGSVGKSVVVSSGSGVVSVGSIVECVVVSLGLVVV